MEKNRWQDIKNIFEVAVDLPEEARESYLDESCGSDLDLRSKVEELLAADSRSDGLLDHSPDLLVKQREFNTSPIPDKIGPYKIESLLGQGGMGSVYKAYHEDDLSRALAVKVVWKSPVNSSFASRFKTEWEVLSKMDHPHIAKLYGDVMLEDGNTFFAMEYVDGVEVTAYCEERNLDLREKLALFLKIGRAVSHAHSKQIIHRDIKPGNILITPEGEAKLLDFGIAKVLDQNILENTVHLTRTGVRVLTPSYASPEQLKSEELSPKSDIYSLGVLLFELLSGQRPHDVVGKSPAEIERLVCSEPAPILSEVVRNNYTTEDYSKNTLFPWKPENQSDLIQKYKGDLDVILSKALRKDANSRYDSVDDFLEDIERHLRSEKIVARPISTTNRLGSFIARYKTEFALSLATFLFMITAAVVIIRPASQDRSGLVSKGGEQEAKVLISLPFAHEGPDELAYLASGISMAINENLSSIDGLRTISFSEPNAVADSAGSPQDIGRVFESDFVLHGKIEYDAEAKVESSFRLSSELIRVSDSLVVWSQYFDQSLEEVFDVEHAVALQVADALNLVLIESDELDQARFMTRDLEAYTYYLRGNEFFRNAEDESKLRLAELMYEQAIKRDDTFSKAHAMLSQVHSRHNFYRFDQSPERCDKSEESAQSAFVHNPSDEVSYLALAMYSYHCRYNFPEALNYFDQALRINPNFGEVLQGKAYVLRRQGKLREALEYFDRMTRADPLRADYLAIAYTNIMVGDYVTAERAFNIASEYFPDEAQLGGIGAFLYLAWQASPQKAREVIERNKSSFSSNDIVGITAIHIDMLERDYQRALTNISSQGKDYFDTQILYLPASMMRARALQALGRMDEARKEYEIARKHLEQFVLENLEDDRGHASLGLVYAGLGMEEKAVESGLRGIALANGDIVQTPYRHTDLAEIYAQLGRYDDAIEQLVATMERPNLISKKLIDIDPRWDSLRDKPGYRGIGAG